MWGNETPRTLPTRIQNCAVALEKGLTFHQRVKYSFHMTQKFFSWIHTQEK